MRIGLYIRGLNSKNDPHKMAEQAKKNGVDFAAFMTYWQEAKKDKRINSRVIAKYTKVFEESGIDPWVWAYPWCGKEQALIDRLAWVKEACEGRLKGFILDPELGYQGWKVGPPVVAPGADQLVSGVLDIMDESMDLGITSFGCAHVHKTFPWDQFCAGFGSPQFYTTDQAGQIRRGLQIWKDTGWEEFMPSVPVFGLNSGLNLGKYLDKIKKEADNLEIPIVGWIFWSYRQLDSVEWRTIKGLSA